MRGQVVDDRQPQRRHRVAGAADRQPQRVVAVHADRDGAADDLGELLGEPGRHLGRVRVDDVAAVVVLDAGAGQGDEVGGREQLLGLGVGQRDRGVGVACRR